MLNGMMDSLESVAESGPAGGSAAADARTVPPGATGATGGADPAWRGTRSGLRAWWRHRWQAAIMFAVCSGLLAVSAMLTPSEAGIGTHQQLGLPPCGFELATGAPCMTCGMTTAFSHAADGNLPASFFTQPTGALLAVLVAAGAIVSGWALISGMALGPLFSWLMRPRHAVLLVVLLLAGWAYKMAIHLGGGSGV